ncbi:hypothetical protein DFH06DRAFT_1243770 [Mycena polygramma]|nr:hypothetical protein DFH06DRAFT_1243770 [Mycena polygramma]
MIRSQVLTGGALEEHLQFFEFLRGEQANTYDMIHALDNLDFVSPLKKFAAALWEIPDPRLARLTCELLENCLPLVHSCLQVYPGPREAIDTRLLVLLARCGVAELGHDEEHTLISILGGILPGTLTFYSVLSRVEKALRKIDQLVLTVALQKSDVSNYWSDFRRLAEHRLAIKHEFDKDRISVKFCDNIECITVSAHTDLRQCSRCRSASYCSPFCQQKDWTDGNHRTVCKRRDSIQDHERPYVSAKERAFLRYILHHDYLTHKLEILEQHVRASLRFGQDTPCYTEFNYIDGDVKIEVLPISELLQHRVSKKDDSLRVRHEMERLARSAGKMQLHVAVIANAGFGRWLCCPLRKTSEINFALECLADDMIFKADQTREQYQERLLMNEDVGAEVHQPIYSWIIPT